MSLKFVELINPYHVSTGGFPKVFVIVYISIFYKITPKLKGRIN